MSQRGWLRWLLVAVGLVVLGGCTGRGDPGRTPAPTTVSPSATGCGSAVRRAPLPAWARAGFTPPDQTTTYVQGAGGDIVGVLFGWPLAAPPARDHQNKILWVARISAGGDALEITARLANSDAVVRRRVEGGPGPSIIDMPTAGCWRFDLSWSGLHDQVDVPYAAG